MIDIDVLISDFEGNVREAIDSIVYEFPALDEYENRRQIDSLADELSIAIHRKLEDLLENELEKAYEAVHDVIGNSYQFNIIDFDGDYLYVTHRDTGIDLTLGIEES
jgi:predicted lipase